MLPKITFNDSAASLVLEAFNISVGEDKFLYKDGEKVLDAVDNKPLTVDEFAGVHKSGIYKGDIGSIIHLSNQ